VTRAHFSDSLYVLMNRVGIGYDVHPLVEGRKLFLGGIELAHDKGLEGHSDADVLIHALADAVLGALGAGDIGHHFPNTDERWRGVSSLVFLEQIRLLLEKRGAVLENVDASVIAEAPKIAPHLDRMKAKLGAALGISVDRVNLKATTNEKLGFAGRGEGIAAMAVACVTLQD
jgi:2-C-methyl-D-erythritol 2,4-cyclodiphosphate synthase